MGSILIQSTLMRRLCGLRVLTLSFALIVPCCQATEPSFTDELWSDIRPLYAETLKHPFLAGLSDGSLARSRFQYYLVQDAHYLRAFAKVLSVLAAKAPREEWAITLNQHATNAIQTEQQLHESVLASYGLSSRQIQETPMAPTNYAYTNHLLAAAYQKSFAHAVAAVLPCYWIYWEVGKELQQKGSKNPDYQRWIDQYSGEEFGQAVSQVLDMVNTEAEHLDISSREELKEIFRTSTRYEWMFWDMAWRKEDWPP